jgi:ribonuclease HI
MAGKSALDREGLSRVLELLGKRLPAELLQPEFPDLTREDFTRLFQTLAKHIRHCQEWSEIFISGQEDRNNQALSASLYCDGASRGNPGPSGAGVSILDQHNRQILELSRFFENATNNEAEYQALITGLKAAEELGIERLQIFSDSELVVKQVLGEYKVRNPRLLPLFREVMAILQQFDDYAIVHVGREFNKQADRLANDAIDRGLRGGEKETYRFAQRE